MKKALTEEARGLEKGQLTSEAVVEPGGVHSNKVGLQARCVVSQLSCANIHCQGRSN